MTNKDYKIIRGRIEIEVPHEDGKLTFVWPVKGPGTYANVKSQIEDAGLQAPTFAQLTSLVYTANQNRDEPEFAEILNKLDNRWLWGFNGILYLPKGKGDYQNGAIIQDNPKTKDDRVFLDKSELVSKLEAGDKSVRFVPFGYKTDVQNVSELAKNPFVIALVSKEGAEKLAELSKRYRNNPGVWSFTNVDNEIARVPDLCGLYYGVRLDVGGDDCWGGNYGFASGVSASTEGAKPTQK